MQLSFVFAFVVEVPSTLLKSFNVPAAPAGLYYAVRKGFLAMTQLLVEEGADVLAKDRLWETVVSGLGRFRVGFAVEFQDSSEDAMQMGARPCFSCDGDSCPLFLSSLNGIQVIDSFGESQN